MGFAGHNRGKQLWPGVGYVRGRIAAKAEEAYMGDDIQCPWCKSYTNTTYRPQICPKCKRVWFRKRDGKYVFVDNAEF